MKHIDIRYSSHGLEPPTAARFSSVTQRARHEIAVAAQAILGPQLDVELRVTLAKAKAAVQIKNRQTTAGGLPVDVETSYVAGGPASMTGTFRLDTGAGKLRAVSAHHWRFELLAGGNRWSLAIAPNDNSCSDTDREFRDRGELEGRAPTPALCWGIINTAIDSYLVREQKHGRI